MEKLLQAEPALKWHAPQKDSHWPSPPNRSLLSLKGKEAVSPRKEGIKDKKAFEL